MLVGERMSHPVLTVTADIPVQDALARMKKDHVRRYPVVDKNGKLVGIVTDNDLLNASPSQATTLSVWEIGYLLSKITVERVMTTKVITTTPDTTVEKAASIMSDANISCLPVMQGNRLVGIITETDLFHILLEMLGARVPGVRLTVEVEDRPGKLFELAGAIHGLGGNIVGMGAIQGESTSTRLLILKVADVKLEALEQAIQPLVEKVVDIRLEKGTL
jgi:acetoin utilization protein AcuB